MKNLVFGGVRGGSYPYGRRSSCFSRGRRFGVRFSSVDYFARSETPFDSVSIKISEVLSLEAVFFVGGCDSFGFAGGGFSFVVFRSSLDVWCEAYA